MAGRWMYLIQQKSIPGVGDTSLFHTSSTRGSSREGIGRIPSTCNFVTPEPSAESRRR